MELTALITVGNPAGLIVSAGMKMYWEKSGRKERKCAIAQSAMI
jgi:hypothetical protein